MQCKKCFLEMSFHHNSQQFMCTCGYKIKKEVKQTDNEAQNCDVSIFKSGNIPQGAYREKTKRRRINWTVGGGTRLDYMCFYGISEDDIFLDDEAKEYHMRKNPEKPSAPASRVYIPTRYRKK